MHVTNPNPQDCRNPLELPVALLGHGQALADLYLPVRVNGDVAAIKGVLKELSSGSEDGRPSAIDHEFIQGYKRVLKCCGQMWKRRAGRIIEESGLSRKEINAGAKMYANSKDDLQIIPRRDAAAQRRG